MTVAQNDPGTVFLGGEYIMVNDLAASEAITPGHLVDRFNNGGIIRWRKHATAGAAVAKAVALNHSMANKGVSDAYAANDLVEVALLQPGSSAWMFIASGQNIAAGQKLESAGDGTLRAFASGTVLFSALENKPTVTALTRIRVEAV